MADTADRANVLIQPPLAWALSFIAGLAIGWLFPLHFVPPALPHLLAGGAIFALGLALAVWAIVTIRRAGSRVEVHKATTAIVRTGPYRVTRNPIYLGMFLGQAGLAVAFDNAWMLAMLAPFYLVIRHGVIAREETYLAGKFGVVYLDYKTSVRRWL